MAKFQKGQSGNARGRPKGVEDKRSALRALLEPYAPKLLDKLVELALAGDGSALRICMDRLIPALKTRDEPVKLPGVGGTLLEQGRAVLAAVNEGTIGPDQAASLMQALSAQSNIVKVDDLERRVQALEEKRNGNP